MSSPAAGFFPVVRPSLRSGQAQRTFPAVILSEDEGERELGG